MKFFRALAKKFPCDKRLHFIIGVAFASVILCFLSIKLVCASLIILGWGIELFQKITKTGTYDNLDALSVVIGGGFVILPKLF